MGSAPGAGQQPGAPAGRQADLPRDPGLSPSTPPPGPGDLSADPQGFPLGAQGHLRSLTPSWSPGTGPAGGGDREQHATRGGLSFHCAGTSPAWGQGQLLVGTRQAIRLLEPGAAWQARCRMWKGLQVTWAFPGLVGSRCVLRKWHEGQTCWSRGQRARPAHTLRASWARTGGRLCLSGPLSPAQTHVSSRGLWAQSSHCPRGPARKVRWPWAAGLGGLCSCDTPTHTHRHRGLRLSLPVEGKWMGYGQVEQTHLRASCTTPRSTQQALPPPARAPVGVLAAGRPGRPLLPARLVWSPGRCAPRHDREDRGMCFSLTLMGELEPVCLVHPKPWPAERWNEGPQQAAGDGARPVRVAVVPGLSVACCGARGCLVQGGGAWSPQTGQLWGCGLSTRGLACQLRPACGV